MYSFQAKIGLEKMRKGENKNYRFVSFQCNGKMKIPKKNRNKIERNKICHYDFISSQNRLENAEKKKKKIIDPFRSYTKRSRKFK